MIFDGNHYRDVGAFQLYGNAQDVVVANTVLERSTGVFAWYVDCRRFSYQDRHVLSVSSSRGPLIRTSVSAY